MQTFSTIPVSRMRLHVLPTRQFKTFSIAMYFGVPLSEDTVTHTALIPYVLRRGNARYPETRQFRERLDELYGAGFGFDIVKRGGYQIVVLRMDIVNDAFVSGESSSLLQEALHFLADTVCRPAMEDGIFKEQYVSSEKETLRKKIQAIVNDKIRYAAERCIAEMCKDEPYRLLALGSVDVLPQITAQSLYDDYTTWLEQASIDLYVVGDTTLEDVQPIVSQSFAFDKPQTVEYKRQDAQRKAVVEREVVEEMDVKQGKLNMGLRTGVTYGDEAYPAALVYNGILGGYPHSKLFVNVREKESLAYYAASRFDGHKGILTIQTGIEIANKDKAEKIIRKQLADMRQGAIREEELAQTKAMIVGTLNEMDDSAFEQIAYHFNSVLSGKERTKQELIEAIRRTDIAAVTEAAQHVELDTIYFLRDRQGGGSIK